MAINPLIALQGQVPDIGRTFGNVLTNLQNFQTLRQREEEAPARQRLLGAQADVAQQQVQTPTQQLDARTLARVKSLGVAGAELVPLLQKNDIAGARATLQRRQKSLEDAGIDSRDTQEALQLLATNPQLLAQRSQQAVDLSTQINQAQTRGAGVKPFAPIVDPATGQLGIPTFDPTTGAAGFEQVPGAPIQETPRQKREREVVKAGSLAEIQISKTEKVETIKQRVKRASDIRRELSTRNREAARSGRNLQQALKLASRASQGLTGAIKVQLARLVPGIDTSNEAALSASLDTLALDQLQAFKGPTTDFEFGVTRNIAGRISDPKSANVARVKSLTRNAWFNQREFDQFDRHTKAGGDPDTFRFNFGEPVKTKSGVFTLQDIQDTAVENNFTIQETIAELNK